MSTATGANSGYADCDEFISHRLKSARSRIKRTDLLTASLLAGVLLIGYVLIFTILDHWVIDGGFSATTRATLLGVVLVLCAGIIYRYVIRPWTQQVHPLFAAKLLDESDEEMNGALLTLVDLNQTDSPAADAIRRTMEKRAAVRLTEVNVDEAIDGGWLMNLSVTLFVLVLSTCIYAVFSPKTINLLRPLSLSSAAVATQTKILRVQPGTTSVQAGGELEVVAVIGGQIPDAVTVLYTTADQTYVDEVLTMSDTDETGRFRLSLVGDGDRGLRQDFSYQVVAGDTRSEVFAVTVDQPPTCSVIQASYEYPDYMELPPRQTQNGNLTAWDGSRVSLVAEATAPVRHAILQFSRDAAFSTPDIEIALKIDGTRLAAEFDLALNDRNEAPKFYRINVTDLDGRVDPQPTVYSVKVRPDEKPNVSLLDPTRDLRVPANAVVPLLIEAEDPDFLLSSVKVGVVINNERVSDEIVFDGSRATPTSRWNGIFDFELKNFDLQEGDVVRYQVIARDNKPPIGTASRTNELQLFIERRVSQEEVEQQRQRDREAQERRMQQEATPQERQPEDGENENPDRSEDAADGQPGGEGDGTGEPGADGNPGGDPSDEPGDSGQRRPDSGNSDNPNPTENGSEGRADGDASDGGAEPSQGTEGGTAESNPTGDDSPNGRQSPAGSGRDRGEVSDDEAMQELLDAYQDALRNADESAAEPSTDPGAPEGDPRDSGDPAASNEPNGNPDVDSANRNPDNGLNEGMDATPDEAAVGEESSTDPMTQDGDPNMQGEPGAQDGDPNKQGEPGAQDGDPNKQGEPGAQDGDPNKQGEPGAQDGDPNKQGEPGAQDGDPNKQGESGAQDGDPNKQGEPGAQDGDPNKQGEPGAQDGDPNKQGEPGAQDGDPNKQGEPGAQDGDPNKQGEPGAQNGDPNQQGDKQGGEGGKQAGEGDKQAGEGGKQGGEGGKQGGEGGKQGGEGGKQGGESGKQGGESGKQGGESGKQGGESGKQGGESGKQGGESGKQGGESGKQGGESGKQGGESGKQGGESGKQGGESGKQGGKGGEGGKPGGKGGGQQGGKGGQSGQGGGQPGQAADGGKPADGGKSADGGKAAGGAGQEDGPGDQAGGDEQGGPQAGKGSGSGDNAAAKFQPDDANVEDAAQAADLVLKRLQKDLERGQVDKELLEKLGWTESELEAFSQRMQQQLSQLQDKPDDQPRSEQRQRRRVEELLKSLDLTSKSRGRVGRSGRDREVQDTTARQAAPPTRYRDQMKLYERSLSEGRRR